MRELLNGVIDVHVHGSPSVAPRMETWEFLEEMDRAGYRAVGLKEHFMPTAGAAQVFNRKRGPSGTQVIGSIVLNAAVGGLNLLALETACLMGAKQAYFPTTSGRAHKTFLQKAGKFGGGALKTPEPAIGLLGENGELDKAAIAIIDFLREHSKMTLCTGHCAAHETDALVRYALSHGIKNVVANHPYSIVEASFEQIEAWAKLGAFIEITAVSVRGVSNTAKISREVIAKVLEVVPVEQVVVSSDFGQAENGSPVEGMLRMAEFLLGDMHFTEAQWNMVAKTTPARLMGFSEKAVSAQPV